MPKWPLSASQVVLGAWVLGVRDPGGVRELARRYKELPGPSPYTLGEVERLARDMPRQGVTLDKLAPADRAMAEWAAQQLRPLLERGEQCP